MRCSFCYETKYIILDINGVQTIKFKCGTRIDEYSQIVQSRSCKSRLNNKRKCYKVIKRRFNFLTKNNIVRNENNDFNPKETLELITEQLEDYEREKIF